MAAFNYPRLANRRGKVLVKYSKPLEIPEAVFSMDRRAASKLIVEKATEEMLKCLVTMDSAEELRGLYLAEKLLRRGRVTPEGKFQRVKDLEGKLASMKTDAPEEYAQVMGQVQEFRKESKRLKVTRNKNALKLTALQFCLAVVKVILSCLLVRIYSDVAWHCRHAADFFRNDRTLREKARTHCP